MKKYVIVLGILLFAFASCEDDDFCAEPTTPRLIIEFYDKESPSDKKPLPMYVWADGKDSVYQLATLDSILLPLDTQNTATHYKIATTNIIDDLNLTYTVSDVYVSESCGYIAEFNDFTVETYTSNWIDRLEVNSTKVENETETHIKIFH